jgi:hypothetical protein
MASSDTDYRQRAAAAVEARIAALHTSATAVARRAGVDPKTVRGLISCAHWPTAATRARIETALDWPAGEITLRAVTNHDGLEAYDTVTLLAEVCRRIKSAGI